MRGESRFQAEVLVPLAWQPMEVREFFGPGRCNTHPITYILSLLLFEHHSID